MSPAQFPNTSAFSPACIRFPREPTRAQVFFPDSDWRNLVMARMTEICGLDRGWDGYKADPVNFHNAHFALEILEKVSAFCGPQPSIIPGVSGDLQIEWHTKAGDIELHVRAPYDVEAWHVTEDGQEEAFLLSSDFTLVSQWVKLLGGTRIASHTTAA